MMFLFKSADRTGKPSSQDRRLNRARSYIENAGPRPAHTYWRRTVTESFKAYSSNNLQFLILVVIGALAGLAMVRRPNDQHWIITAILVGIAGSWLGSEIAHIIGVVERGSAALFVAAGVGAVVTLGVWKRLHP